MQSFPATQIEHLSVSRLIIGSNWFAGFSHTSHARDRFIRETMTADRIADVLEVFFEAGVTAFCGISTNFPHMDDAIKDAEDRTGRRCIRIATPHLDLSDSPDAMSNVARTLDAHAAIGADFCMPHQATTDALVDRVNRRITGMDKYLAMIRERGMVPGLSTHTPEAILYADETGLDVATYIQIYNAIGFLMQVEVDWVHRIIWNAKKPVMTIKPLAAGRLIPIAGLGFAWGTLREQDMVTIGTLTPDEAVEVIELSRALLERRLPQFDLQRTRSKKSLDADAIKKVAAHTA